MAIPFFPIENHSEEGFGGFRKIHVPDFRGQLLLQKQNKKIMCVNPNDKLIII